MALTKEQRELLAEARHRIETKHERFICIALVNASNFSLRPRYQVAATALREYIGQQLAPDISLESWQERVLGWPIGSRSRAQLRQDRIDWIDWMLDEPKDEK